MKHVPPLQREQFDGHAPPFGTNGVQPGVGPPSADASRFARPPLATLPPVAASTPPLPGARPPVPSDPPVPGDPPSPTRPPALDCAPPVLCDTPPAERPPVEPREPPEPATTPPLEGPLPDAPGMPPDEVVPAEASPWVEAPPVSSAPFDRNRDVSPSELHAAIIEAKHPAAAAIDLRTALQSYLRSARYGASVLVQGAAASGELKNAITRYSLRSASAHSGPHRASDLTLG